MAYDQGGTEGFKTKKALKEAAKNGTPIYLYTTSAFGGFIGYADKLDEGTTFVVVGPDPFARRDWFASVSRKGDKVTVK